jgi:hypothetical protein
MYYLLKILKITQKLICMVVNLKNQLNLVVYQKPVVADDKSFTKTKTSIVNTPNPRPKQEPIKNVSVVDSKLNNTKLPDKVENINTNIPKMFDNTYMSNGAYLPASGINGVIRKKGTHEIVAWAKGDPATGIAKYYPPDTDTRKRLEYQIWW